MIQRVGFATASFIGYEHLEALDFQEAGNLMKHAASGNNCGSKASR